MKKVITALLCVCAATAAFAQSKKYWGDAALNDIHGINWAYKSYHAAMVNPGDKAFGYTLYDSYKKHSKKAYKARSEKQYQKAVKNFLLSLGESSMTAAFDNDITPPKKAKSIEAAAQPFSVEFFEGNNAWVYLHSFDSAAQNPEYLAQELAKAKTADIIVLDLRFNADTGPQAGDIIMQALYGADFALNNKAGLNKNRQKYTRLTDFSLEEIKAKYPADYYLKLKEAFDKGAEVYTEDLPAQEYKEMQNPLGARVYLLTDADCAAACLNFIQAVKSAGNAAHIGKAPRADGGYTGFVFIPLNSGMGKFPVAYSGYTSPGKSGGHTPGVAYKGDTDKTEKLQKWFIKRFAKK